MFAPTSTQPTLNARADVRQAREFVNETPQRIRTQNLFTWGAVRPLIAAAFVVLGAVVGASAAEQHKPLALHPDNPHYFLFRGKPTIIITSAEHYGAVLNLDFDYVKYLDELAAHGLNNTRMFAGAYVEDAKAFNIAQNTLAPLKDRFICPFARSETPGYPNGGNKFDLTKWDDAYFRRLKDFLKQASDRGVIVEMNLFCPFYEDSMWKLSPQNAANNVNDIGHCKREEVYTLDKHDGLLAIHEAMTKKIVTELNEFDNLYYEVCNEPYFGGVTMDWQHRIAETIQAAEKDLPNKHLISLNIANGGKKVENPHPAISIFNFHYAHPPTAVGAELRPQQADRRQRDGLQGHQGRPLPHGGLGVHPGRRRALQQPGLLVHGRARGRHV